MTKWKRIHLLEQSDRLPVITEDSKLARRLLSDPKEIAEHNMLIDSI